MRRGLRNILLLFLVLLLLSFGGVVSLFLVQNSHWILVKIPTVRLDLADPFYHIAYETPLYVVIFLVFICGMIFAGVVSLPGIVKRAIRSRRERRFIEDLEGELTDLRNMPVINPAPFENVDEELSENEEPTEPDLDLDVSNSSEDEAELLSDLKEPDKGRAQ